MPPIPCYVLRTTPHVATENERLAGMGCVELISPDGNASARMLTGEELEDALGEFDAEEP